MLRLRDDLSPPPAWRRSAVAVVSVAAAALLSALLHPWLTAAPLAPFFAAVALAAWAGGVGPALAAILLALPLISLVALDPLGAWSLSAADQTAMVIFVLVAALLVGLSASRDRAAQAQRAAQARLERMLNIPGVGVLRFDAAGTLTDANDAFLAMTGYRRETIASGVLTWRDMTPPEYVASSEAQLAQLAATGQIGPYEKEYLRADGTRAWMMFAGAALEDGAVVKYGLDISARKRAEAALPASEDRARFLAEASSVLAADLDLDAAVERVVRLAVPRLADWCTIDLLGPDGALHRLAIIHRDSQRGPIAEALRHEYPVIAADRVHTTWKVLRSGTPWVDPDVAPDRFVAEARDEHHLAFLRQLGFASELVVPLVARDRALGVLTLVHGDSGRRFGADDVPFAEELARHCALAIDNARLYQEARQAEAKVRRLFDTGVIGLLVADGDRIFEANDPLLQLVGYTQDDLAAGQLRWSDLTPPDSAAAMAQALADVARRGVCAPFEVEFVRQDGARVPVLLGGAALERTGSPWIGAVVDLTAQKDAERDRIAFIDAATHDLKNPLTVVRGRAQLLQRQFRRAEAVNAATIAAELQAIDADAGRMLALINEALDAAHLRAGRPLALRRDDVDLVALAAACAQEAERRGAQHPVQVAAAVPTLVGVWDRARLERVVANLLDNASKYSPDGGEIVIAVDREHDAAGGAWAILRVRDQGVGIPAADLPYVFDRFRRGGNVGGIAGSGVGLAGAKQIISQLGGTIAVASEAGQGTTVTVRLPLGASGASASAPG